MVRRLAITAAVLILAGTIAAVWMRCNQATKPPLSREAFIVRYLDWAGMGQNSTGEINQKRAGLAQQDSIGWQDFQATYRWYQDHPKAWLEVNQEIITRLKAVSPTTKVLEPH